MIIKFVLTFREIEEVVNHLLSVLDTATEL